MVDVDRQIQMTLSLSFVKSKYCKHLKSIGNFTYKLTYHTSQTNFVFYSVCFFWRSYVHWFLYQCAHFINCYNSHDVIDHFGYLSLTQDMLNIRI